MSQTRSKSDAPADDTIVRLLTPRQRRTCAAVWGDARTHRETARAHGITCDASRKRTYRARQRLRASGIEPPDGRRRRTTALQLSLNENV
jgi:DNA-directed RNA polymerase specialized sigma24 family protein